MLFRYYFGSDALFDETVLNGLKRSVQPSKDFYERHIDANGFLIECGVETILVSF